MHSEEHLVTVIWEPISAIGQQPMCFFCWHIILRGIMILGRKSRLIVEISYGESALMDK